MGLFDSGGIGTSGSSLFGGGGSSGDSGDSVKSAIISGLFGLGGNLLSGYGQGKISEAQLAQQRDLALRDEALKREQLAQQNNQTGLQSTQLDPLAQQKSRQQQALLAAILPGLRNASVSSSIPGMNQFIPQVSGGLRIPEGGFDASTLGYFSPESRAQAEGQYYQQAAPFSSAPDLSKVGYGQAGAGVTDPANATYNTATSEAKKRNDALMAALQQQSTAPGASTSSSSTGSKIKSAAGGVLKSAATGAALGSVVPGIGTLIGGLGGGLVGGLKRLFS